MNIGGMPFDGQGETVFMAETLQSARESLPARVYSKDLIEILFRLPYTKVQPLVDAGIAKRKTAADYSKVLEKITTLQIYRMGKEKPYLNKKSNNTPDSLF
jgi:hypothetical protein